MIELSLTLVDYMFKLADKRSLKRRNRYATLIKPAFDAAETIYKDYLAIATKVHQMAEDRRPFRDIERFLEDRRTEFKPLRMKLRVFVEREDFAEGFSLDDSSPRRYELLSESQSDFEKGVFGLLHSGIQTVEVDGSLRKYIRGGHTILDMVQWVAFWGSLEESISKTEDIAPAARTEKIEELYRDLLSSIRLQELALEKAYELMLRGYREAIEQS
jgi:hypothetical protein